MKKIQLIFFLFLLCISCGKHYKTKDVDQQNGFYFWKTTAAFDQEEYARLDSFDTKAIYLRLFDVGWDDVRKDAAPMGEMTMYSYGEVPYAKYEVVPTIFITNETFRNIDEKNLEQLSLRIYKKILGHFTSVGLQATYQVDYETYGSPYYQSSKDFRELVRQDSLSHSYFDHVKEFQFDCDWTESTKDKYFTFLKIMKSKLIGKIISATVRLYPYKYPDKAGVPPVDKGMLMCYNVGDVRNVESGNSIFDKREVYKYLKGVKSYPLTLDYAFPIFEWCSIYRRNKLIKLIPIEDMYFSDNNFKEISKNNVVRYEVIEEMELYGYDMKLIKGDIVKIESLPYDEVIEVAGYISSINTNKEPKIVLFDYNKKTVRENEKSVKKIFGCF